MIISNWSLKCLLKIFKRSKCDTKLLLREYQFLRQSHVYIFIFKNPRFIFKQVFSELEVKMSLISWKWHNSKKLSVAFKLNQKGKNYVPIILVSLFIISKKTRINLSKNPLGGRRMW